MKRILVTGGLGMIGRELVELLKKDAHNDIRIADLKKGDDLRDYNTCKRLCKDIDEIYSLVGVKGNPRMTVERPLDFMLPMMQCDTNLIRASLEQNVDKFLYTSSIAVLYPQMDTYPAWAKKSGEILIEAIKIQYPERKYYVVRPANVYGRFDDFANPQAMVITSLIRKAFTTPILEIWGSGKEIRDFIHAKDVARGMIQTMEHIPIEPINLCSGKYHTIQEVVDIIKSCVDKDLVIKYDGRSVGSKARSMFPNGHLVAFKPKISLEKGIKDTVEWYKKQHYYRYGPETETLYYEDIS